MRLGSLRESLASLSLLEASDLLSPTVEEEDDAGCAGAGDFPGVAGFSGAAARSGLRISAVFGLPATGPAAPPTPTAAPTPSGRRISVLLGFSFRSGLRNS